MMPSKLWPQLKHQQVGDLYLFINPQLDLTPVFNTVAWANVTHLSSFNFTHKAQTTRFKSPAKDL